MVTWLPVDGSIIVFAHAYLDDAWGFALGWLYTITNSLAAAGEVAAVAAIFGFWTDAVNNGKVQSTHRRVDYSINSFFRGLRRCHYHVINRSQRFRRAHFRRGRILLLIVQDLPYPHANYYDL